MKLDRTIAPLPPISDPGSKPLTPGPSQPTQGEFHPTEEKDLPPGQITIAVSLFALLYACLAVEVKVAKILGWKRIVILIMSFFMVLITEFAIEGMLIRE